jgi:hypothetical protein
LLSIKNGAKPAGYASNSAPKKYLMLIEMVIRLWQGDWIALSVLSVGSIAPILPSYQLKNE